MRALSLSSGLGPRLLECPKCHTATETDRTEWDRMTVEQKLRYALVSLIYMFVIGFFGGIATQGVLHFFTAGPFEEKMKLGPGFQVGWMVWALLVAGLQLYRIHASRARTEAGEDIPWITSPASMFCHLQWKVLAAPMVVGLIGWLAAVAYDSLFGI